MLAGVSASWAVENREAIAATLRSSLGLTTAEELVITAISKLGRELEAGARRLQAGGVKIDFVIGVSNNSRAQVAESAMSGLASGSAGLLVQFSAVLDEELTKRGQPPVNLPATTMAFSSPEKEIVDVGSASWGAGPQTVYKNTIGYQAGRDDAANKNQGPAAQTSLNGIVLGALLGAVCMGLFATGVYMRYLSCASFLPKSCANPIFTHHPQSADASFWPGRASLLLVVNHVVVWR